MYTYSLQVKVYKGWGIPLGSKYLSPQYYTYNFVIRGITRREYEDWQRQYPSLVDLEGKILKEAVISGPTHFRGVEWNWDDCFAGVAEQVLQKIYNLSGLGEVLDVEVSNPVEEYLNSSVARFDLVILMALDQYKLEDLMTIDHREWNMLL